MDGVLHYCVSNMPAAVPHTSTFGLTNATFPYVMQIASKGFEKACEDSPAICEGVNTYQGHVTYPAVAESQGRDFKELSGDSIIRDSQERSKRLVAAARFFRNSPFESRLSVTERIRIRV